jgi:hypothetical protein
MSNLSKRRLAYFLYLTPTCYITIYAAEYFQLPQIAGIFVFFIVLIIGRIAIDRIFNDVSDEKHT